MSFSAWGDRNMLDLSSAFSSYWIITMLVIFISTNSALCAAILFNEFEGLWLIRNVKNSMLLLLQNNLSIDMQSIIAHFTIKLDCNWTEKLASSKIGIEKNT